MSLGVARIRNSAFQIFQITNWYLVWKALNFSQIQDKLKFENVTLFFTDLLLSDNDCNAIYLPDVEAEEVLLLHQCLLTPDLEDGPVQKLAQLFNLLEIRLDLYCDAQKGSYTLKNTLAKQVV